MQASRHSITRHEQESRDLYRTTWERIHGPGSWVRGLYVWRIGFQVSLGVA